MSAAVGVAWICATCGVQQGPSTTPPETCPICEDERQYVGAGGQQWTTLADLRRTHANVLTELEPGLLSIRTEPRFAIGQRAFLVETPEGNVLWDCVSLLDDATVAALRARGGVAAIAISHPHFHATMAEWSRAFGDVPIWIHEGDQRWIPRHAAAVQTWSDIPPSLPGGLRLVRVGGHFEGSQVLFWPAGAASKGALLVADMPNVCSDDRWVTFMRSYPNFIPLSAQAVEGVVAPLAALPFDRIYGWAPERFIHTGAKDAVLRSKVRQLRALLDVDLGRSGHGAQLVVRRREDRGGMTGRGPQLVVPAQPGVQVGPDGRGVANRRDASDDLAGVLAYELGPGAA